MAQSQDDIVRAAEAREKISISGHIKNIRLRLSDFSAEKESGSDVFVNICQLLKSASKLESMDFSDRNFAKEWCESIAELVLSCPTLTSLSLSSGKLDSGIQSLCNIIKSNYGNLKRINFGILPDSAAVLLLDALKSNTTLEDVAINMQMKLIPGAISIQPERKFEAELGDKLIISDNLKRLTVKTDNEQIIKFICDGLQCNSTLEELEFTLSDFGRNGLNHIAKIVSSDQIRLKSLKLYACDLGENLQSFFEAIKKNTTLEKLSLPHSALLSPEGQYKGLRTMSATNIHSLFEAVSENNSIRKFDWKSNDQAASQQMVDLIQKKKFSHLKIDLLIDPRIVTVSSGLKVIESLKYDKLVSLEISGMFVEDELVQSLSRFIAETKSLKKLRAKSQPKADIIQGLIKNTSITDLDISGIYLKSTSDLSALHELISTNKSITKLNISSLPQTHKTRFETLFKAIKFNRTITDLTCTPLAYHAADILEQFDMISDAMKVNDTLLYLTAHGRTQDAVSQGETMEVHQNQLILEKYRELFSVNKSLRRLEFAEIRGAPVSKPLPIMTEVRRLWNNNLAHQSEIKTNTIIIAKNIARQIGEIIIPREIWRQIFEYVRYSCVPELDAIIKTIFD